MEGNYFIILLTCLLFVYKYKTDYSVFYSFYVFGNYKENKGFTLAFEKPSIRALLPSGF